jgi:hypothetical protein
MSRLRPRLALPLLAVLALSACALFGGKTLSLDESLAAAYTTHTAVVNATTTSLQAGTITAAQADKVLAMAQTSRAILDAARVAEQAGNATAANNQLALAANALTALQTFLNASKGKT